MRRLIGLIHRITYATLFAVMTWYACGFPAAFGEYVTIQTAVCYELSYPTAVVGRLTAPYRGIHVFFDRVYEIMLRGGAQEICEKDPASCR